MEHPVFELVKLAIPIDLVEGVVDEPVDELGLAYPGVPDHNNPHAALPHD